jgi:outer membrane protein assembly factor BamD (BamD/ComL family)
LHQAFASLAQFRGLRFDPTPIIDARAQLLDIERDYPAMAADEHVAEAVDRIDSAFASKLLVTAEFYQRTGELRAAAYFYRFLINTYASSPEAAQAKDRLAKLPESVKGPPYPPPSNGFPPATRPTAEAQ